MELRPSHLQGSKMSCLSTRNHMRYKTWLNLMEDILWYTMIYYDILRATQRHLRIDWTPCPAMVCTCQKATKHSPTWINDNKRSSFWLDPGPGGGPVYKEFFIKLQFSKKHDAANEPECSHVEHFCETSYLNNTFFPMRKKVECRVWSVECRV